MSKARTLVILKRGLGGLGGTPRGEHSHCTIYDTRLSRYVGRVTEGGWVIDLLADDGRDLRPPITPADAYAAPMARGDWPDDREDPHAIRGRANLEWCSPRALADYWRERGARVGQRQGQEIVWDDGTREEIDESQQFYG